ncbi:hypothetical protein EOD42_08685 [Rhodovarius crocodyli]|uniref:Transporter n=1 Tax=Rhodovarius crocodyli TaxID=1979269 RepID=A0A437MJL0_9PROT|nr:hypothetical protein [Rhodovarius crocodyli]RVT97857.1 hypothetical protein EOD42_08685 [Rhodovarius crocodyli]
MRAAAAALICLIPGGAWAQQSLGLPPPAPDSPFLYDRQAAVVATSSGYGASFSQDVRVRYAEPLWGGRAAIRIETPMVYARVAGVAAAVGPDTDATAHDGPHSRRGLAAGDVSARLSALLWAGGTGAVQLFADISAPTGNGMTGAARFIASPGLSGIWFPWSRLGVGAQYRHSAGFAGSAAAPRVNLGELDLFLFWRVLPGRAWLTLNPTQRFDIARGAMSGGTLRLTAGLRLGENVTAYVRPGLGVGRDRPYGWSVETGITFSGL